MSEGILTGITCSFCCIFQDEPEAKSVSWAGEDSSPESVGCRVSPGPKKVSVTGVPLSQDKFEWKNVTWAGPDSCPESVGYRTHPEPKKVTVTAVPKSQDKPEAKNVIWASPNSSPESVGAQATVAGVPRNHVEQQVSPRTFMLQYLYTLHRQYRSAISHLCSCTITIIGRGTNRGQ